MNERLLDIACCPVTHQDLRKADSALLETLNRRIADGDVSTASGAPVKSPFQAGLVTRDRKRFYPVHDGLVTLLEAESVSLDDLN